MRWRFLGAYPLKGTVEVVRVQGVDVYSHIDDWMAAGVVIGLADPLYPNQRNRLDVWRLTLDGREVQFAAGEFTNGVWGTYVLDDTEGRPPVTESLCEHLAGFEREVLSRGLKPSFPGQAWSKAGFWVYFDCQFDFEAIHKRYRFDDCVIDYEHLGTHDGQEAGFVCMECATAIMGHHPEMARNKLVYR